MTMSEDKDKKKEPKGKGKDETPANQKDELDPEQQKKLEAMLKKLGLSKDVLKGPDGSSKLPKDMDKYKFWKTQPVQSFGTTTLPSNTGTISNTI